MAEASCRLDKEVPNHSTSDVSTTEYKGNAAFEGIKEFGLNRLAFRYRTDTERLAILSEVYFPGWRAYIKETGKELPVMPVNLALRGIVVPAGSGTVTLEFTPNLFWPGLLISLGSVCIFLVLLLKNLLAWKGEPDMTDAPVKQKARACGPFEEDRQGLNDW